MDTHARLQQLLRDADGRSTNFQKSAVWHSPQSVISSEETQSLPLQPLRRYAKDSASLCHSSLLTLIWWNSPQT